jgi:hypothetical protein
VTVVDHRLLAVRVWMVGMGQSLRRGSVFQQSACVRESMAVLEECLRRPIYGLVVP